MTYCVDTITETVVCHQMNTEPQVYFCYTAKTWKAYKIIRLRFHWKNKLFIYDLVKEAIILQTKEHWMYIG